MVYPGAGLPISTGSAWGTSLTAGAAGHVVRSTGSAYADSAILTADLPSVNNVRLCEYAILGNGTAGALQTTDSVTFTCYNDFGATVTVLAVRCLADAGTTTTVTPIKHGGSSTSLLTGALTCGNGTFATGTLNGTPTIANGESIDGNITVAGTATGIRLVFKLSF